jgi:chlorobactene glucosyltransferase
VGKNWACHQLDQASSGELILFTDADTIHAPDMLQASTSALIAEHADLVTAFPREQVVTWGERLLLPVMGFGIFTFFPIRLVQKLHLPEFSVTIGQFMLFKHTAYTAMGGYEAVKSDAVDDMCLGRLIQTNGGEWRLLDGTRHVSCRMYRGFWEAVGGFGKSTFAVFDYRILPYLLGWLLVDFAFLEPVVVIATLLIRPPLTYLPLLYAAISVALSILLWIVSNRRFQFPAYLAFLYPISLALFMVVVARSLFRTATWKGRQLNRPPVRWL